MSDNRENKHNEGPHDSEEEKYSFLQETVKDEQRSKKGIMGNLCRLAGRGLIFGLMQPIMQFVGNLGYVGDRKSTRLNSSHWNKSRMPSSA